MDDVSDEKEKREMKDNLPVACHRKSLHIERSDAFIDLLGSERISLLTSGDEQRIRSFAMNVIVEDGIFEAQGNVEEKQSEANDIRLLLSSRLISARLTWVCSYSVFHCEWLSIDRSFRTQW